MMQKTKLVKKNKSQPTRGKVSTAPRTVKRTVPAAVSSKTQGRTPPSRVLKNREIVATLSASAKAGFFPLGASADVPGYDLNPGNSLLFPWLSSQALGWEKFRFNKLRFSLLPGNPTSIAGRVYAFVDYDYDDPVPADFTALAGNWGLVTSDVWSSVSIDVDCQRLNAGMPFRYVSRQTRANGVEPRTIYAGYFFVAISGTSATTTWDLVVDYDVELLVPQTVTATPDVPLPLTAMSVASAFANNYKAVTIPQAVPEAVMVGGEAPSLLTTSSGYVIPEGTRILDLSNLRKGALTWNALLQGLVDAPSVTAIGTALEAAVFNSAGGFLGFASQLPNTYGTPLASADPNTWATAGANLEASWTIQMANLFLTYPAARFLALLLYNGTGKPGNTGSALTGALKLLMGQY